MPNNRKPRILLVEDHDKVLEFTRYMLDEGGYDVVCSEDGADALVKLISSHYDLLITGVGMQYFCGPQLIRILQESGIETPVVLLTANRLPDSDLSALRIDRSRFVLKPFSPQELLAAVEDCLAGG